MAYLRERFPIFKQKVYLNSCSQGALSLDVRAAYGQYLEDWDCQGSPWELWVQRTEAARHAFAGLVNAEPDEVAVTTSVSASISARASALDFGGERNKVVVSDFEFPTVGQIWHAQEARGARVEHVRAAGHSVPLERFADAIDERTKLVSITHVCYRNGARLDVPAIVEMAHQKGALVLLDSYQALGTMPVDVKKLQVDFLVGGVLTMTVISLRPQRGVLSPARRRFRISMPQWLGSNWYSRSGWSVSSGRSGKLPARSRRGRCGAGSTS
jgi:selenocysteine lyase/cysteine desulfurase